MINAFTANQLQQSLTGTMSSGHYYCFLRPWMDDGHNSGLLHWVRFDDEQITKVTDYAALQDNYGGDDLIVWNYMTYNLEELQEKQAWKRQNWQSQARINNAYTLCYIREDMIQDMLRPPAPSQSLVMYFVGCV